MRTGAGWTQLGGRGPVGQAAVPGATAPPGPDAAQAGPGAGTAVRVVEGVAGGRGVGQHVVQQHAGKPAKHKHGTVDRRRTCLQ